MSHSDAFVIVGGGRAAASAAEELRSRGFAGSVRVIASEDHPPYDHPPLSKDYLQGASELDSVLLHPEDWYSENRVQLTTAVTADALDPAAHLLTLSTGEEVRYDRLLIATGARARRAGVDGEDLPGVHSLRTLDDGIALRAALAGGGHSVAVIGSGWIGMEVAASARTLGNEVTVIGRGAVPLSSAIGDELGQYLRRVHERHGVAIRMSDSVAGVVGSDRAMGVLLDSGEAVPADVVVVAVGAEPAVELARAAGLDVDDGILTDSSLATSAPDVFAAGDAANALHPILGVRSRSEHWANASDQGVVAARSMLGESAVFDAIPYFFTDQFEFSMEYSGFPTLARDARIVYRGDPEHGEFVAFWVDGRSRVVAEMNVNVWDVSDQLQRLIRAAKPVDVGAIADAGVDLASLGLASL